jgi:electron transport complex protein RnfG
VAREPGVSLAALRDKLAYQAVLLGGVALAASAALALANMHTRDPIARAQARDLELSLVQVLPAGSYDNDLLQDTVAVAGDEGAVTVYRARKAGTLNAVIYRMRGQGYAGPIELVMGVDRDGRVLGVRVTRHSETPGLGDKIDAAKTDWVLGFDGKSLGHPDTAHWAVKKDGGDFDQFAGATITPRAVVKTVRRGLEFFAAHRAAMLDGSPAVAAKEAEK